MITAICILSGVIVFEAFIIAVLIVTIKEEKKHPDDVPLIDLVAFEKEWRDIHD